MNSEMQSVIPAMETCESVDRKDIQAGHNNGYTQQNVLHVKIDRELLGTHHGLAEPQSPTGEFTLGLAEFDDTIPESQRQILSQFKDGGMIPGFELVRRFGGDFSDQSQIADIGLAIRELNKNLRPKGKELINSGTNSNPLWELRDFDVSYLESYRTYQSLLEEKSSQPEESVQDEKPCDFGVQLKNSEEVNLSVFDKEKQKNERFKNLVKRVPSITEDITEAVKKHINSNTTMYYPVQAQTVFGYSRSDMLRILGRRIINPDHGPDHHDYLTPVEAIMIFLAKRNYGKLKKSMIKTVEEIIVAEIEKTQLNRPSGK